MNGRRALSVAFVGLIALWPLQTKGDAQEKPVVLAPVKAYKDTGQTPIRKDPFRIPLEPKVDLLLAISIGVSQWRAAGDDVAAVMARADAALYRAKEAGRNCVATTTRAAA